MEETQKNQPDQSLQKLPGVVVRELEEYTEKIRQFRLGKLDDTKMQKFRLQFGTYAQRQEGVQMHGGIGMTDAHDAGLYLKRARVVEALYGGAAFHRDRYAALLGF